jgi:hypothetical protein
MKRRELFAALAVPFGAVLATHVRDVLAYDNPRRRVRHRLRVRRRIRRHAFTRLRFGRPFWVVPIGLAAGWELNHDHRVVVVREVRIVEKDGVKSEVAVVQDAGGKTEEIEITREDTADNRKNLAGTVLDEADTTTPAIEDEPQG